jgi:hypothetical protein
MNSPLFGARWRDKIPTWYFQDQQATFKINKRLSRSTSDFQDQQQICLRRRILSETSAPAIISLVSRDLCAGALTRRDQTGGRVLPSRLGYTRYTDAVLYYSRDR